MLFKLGGSNNEFWCCFYVMYVMSGTLISMSSVKQTSQTATANVQAYRQTDRQCRARRGLKGALSYVYSRYTNVCYICINIGDILLNFEI